MTRSFFSNATCTKYYFGTDTTETYECQVRLTDAGGIAVSYANNEGGQSDYKGKEDGQVHYLLEMSSSVGLLSLPTARRLVRPSQTSQ